MQRLNLVPPTPEPPSTPQSPSTTGCNPLLPVADPARLKEVTRRSELIVNSGQVPEWIFICGVPGGTLTFNAGADHGPLMLLFTTAYAARDYIRVTKAAAEVRQLKFDSIPEVSRNWIAAGVDKFVMNRCPRCKVMNVIPLEKMNEKANLFQIWALYRALQLFYGEVKVREFVQYLGSSRPRARAALEQIRDHIDCSVPYVFDLIAFLCRGDQDNDAKAAAIERLKEFGPQFADWESRWDSSSIAGTLATAMVGLGMSFGIQLKTPPR